MEGAADTSHSVEVKAGVLNRAKGVLRGFAGGLSRGTSRAIVARGASAAYARSPAVTQATSVNPRPTGKASISPAAASMSGDAFHPQPTLLPVGSRPAVTRPR